MGLDMYLEAEYYQPHYDHNGADAKKRFEGIIENTNIVIPEGARHPDYTHIVIEAAYWRKVNAVHSWFVREVQDGVDECQRSNVSADDLEKLVKLCENILATVVWDVPEGTDPFNVKDYVYPNVLSYDKATVEALQPQSGFFFGSTEIDSWYFVGLHETVQMLKPWIEFYNAKMHAQDYKGLPDFYYRASW